MSENRITYKTLVKLAPDVQEKVIRYALKKYGGDKEWIEKVWEKRSFDRIGKKYFKEYLITVEGKI